MATKAYDIIKRPIITEQSMGETEMKRYTFEVATTANKIEIAKAVEEIFGVKVAKVNNLNNQGKMKRMGARTAGRRSIPASSMWVPASAGLLLAQWVISYLTDGNTAH